MTTTIASSAGELFTSPVTSYAIACAICFAGGILVGGLLVIALWYHFYLDEGLRAIETYAGKEWGE